MPIPRLSFCVVLMACLAGCGGSSGGSGGSATTVTYTFIGSAPTAVATQIGSGAYTQATLQSGALTLSIPSGTTNYSIAYACLAETIATSTGNVESVVDASIEDGTSIRVGGCESLGTPPAMGVATLQVNAAAISGAAWVGVGDEIQPWSSSTISFSRQMVAGTSDVFVYARDSTQNVLAVRILRNQTIPGALNGGNPVVLGVSDETVPQAITYKNVPAGFSAPTTFVQYLPTLGDQTLASGVILDNDATSQYLSVPPSAVQSGDEYAFSANVVSATTPTESEGVETIPTNNGGPQTFTFPPPWSYAGPTAAALPTFNFNYSGFSGLSSVRESVSMFWVQGAGLGNQIFVSATPNFQNGATALAVPNLSSLTGFIAPAPSGTAIQWFAFIDQGLPLVGAGSQSATTFQTVRNSGIYIEP